MSTEENKNRGNSVSFEDIIKRLKEPFPFDETEWKVQATNTEKTRGLAVVYINSRAIQNRLDEIVGPQNWSNEYKPWQDKSQICGISIFDVTRGIWVTKQDGAENTDYEPIKGGLSDAFKRAAVMWGLGRYLYDIDAIWVEIETKGKSSYIKDSEKKKLEAHYNKFVKSFTSGSGAQPTKAPTQATGNKSAPEDKKPAPQSSKPAPAQQKKDTKPKTEAEYDFKINSASESGSSTCLKLLGKDGKEITAYVKKGSPGIKNGACIKNVQMDKKEATFGAYYLLNKYDVAAAA